MGFFDKARQAAEQARVRASETVTQARESAKPAMQQTQQGLSQAGSAAKEAAGSARKGLATVVERIDPSLLADIIIKATALQEKANEALRVKTSPYRISEITITATIPPQIGFSIARIGDVEETLTGHEVDSTELVTEAIEDPAAPIVSLAGDGALAGAGSASAEAATEAGTDGSGALADVGESLSEVGESLTEVGDSLSAAGSVPPTNEDPHQNG